MSMPARASEGAASRATILVTGATGYVGWRLYEELAGRGLPVRCMARRPDNLRSRVRPGTEVVPGDALDEASLRAAMQGVDTAFYLIHSMGSASGFEEQDRRAARNFASAAAAAGVRRIVYLGGLGDPSADLSPHLRSRQEVGRLLAAGPVPVIELRASVVVGSGSLSFELVRALVERLPVMIIPRWTKVKTQPIAVDDLIAYLVACLDLPADAGRVYEIGGADVVSYEDLMRVYAELRGLKRLFLRVPVITPALSSRWLGLVTPVYARIGRKLIESIRHATLVTDPAAARDFAVRPVGMREAISRALRQEEEALVASRWYDAVSSGGVERSWAGVRFGHSFLDSRSVHLDVPPEGAFAPVRRIGGRTGWYALNWLWRVRGALDLLVGGVGRRRARRDPEDLRVGDALDFWRVERYEPGRLLRLQAEMKLPGRAWLEFEVQPEGAGSILRQTARFDPVGLAGLAYWYLVYPLHAGVFRRMLAGIARAASAAPSA